MADKFGIIITVENYQPNRSGLSQVKYATADGIAMKKLFIEKIGIEEDHILMYQDSVFTCTSFQEDIRYHFKQLSPDTILYFYYAGHGFFMDGRNYLTTYETSTLHLKQTSISFENVIMEEFRNSPANTLVAFIDACAEGISDNSRSISARNIDFKIIKDAAIENGFNYAIFFACSPEEKSYSSDSLQHGIWTWHILKAFDVATNAYGLLPCKSAETLKNYLREEVQRYTKDHQEEGIKQQTPYAIISEGNIAQIFKSSDTENTFEYWINFFYEEFFNLCSIANAEHNTGYDSDAVMYNFTVAQDICWDLSLKFDLYSNWRHALLCLQFFSSWIQNGIEFDFPHSVQVEVLESIKLFIASLSASVDVD